MMHIEKLMHNDLGKGAAETNGSRSKIIIVSFEVTEDQFRMFNSLGLFDLGGTLFNSCAIYDKVDPLTNGAHFMHNFPDCEITDSTESVINVKWPDGSTMSFGSEWWNAPYKK